MTGRFATVSTVFDGFRGGQKPGFPGFSEAPSNEPFKTAKTVSGQISADQAFDRITADIKDQLATVAKQ